MVSPVTDPELLAQLEGSDQPQQSISPVRDPKILAQLESEQSGDNYSVGGFARNVGRQVTGIPGAVVNAVKGGYQLATMPPGQFGQVAKEFSPVLPDKSSPIGVRPGAVYSGIVGEYSNPLKRAYEKPLSTAFDVATVATPILRGTKAGAALAEAGRMASAPVRSILRGTGDLAASGTKKILGATFGPTEEAITARLANPQKLAAAAPYEDLANEMAGTLNNLQRKIQAADDEAWGSLLKLKAEPRSKIIEFLKEARREAQVTGGKAVGAADKRAVDTINNLIKDIENVKQKGVSGDIEHMLDQRQIREIIQSADRNINWADPAASSTNKALIQFRVKLNEYLRKENPDFADIMDPLAKRTELLNDLSKSFSMEKEAGRFIPSNTTAGKFPQVLDEKKLQSRSILGKLKEETGQDYLDKAQTYKYARQFESGAGKEAGSRRVNLFGVLGAGAGSVVGGTPGAVLGSVAGAVGGSFLDKQGGAVLGKLLDGYTKAKKAIPTLTMDEYIPIAMYQTSRGAGTVAESGAGSLGLNIPMPAYAGTGQPENKKLTEEKAREYLNKAGGDKEKARQFATADGWIY